VSTGYGDNFKVIGTIYLVDGKIVYSTEEVEKLMGKPMLPGDEWVSYLLGRFSHSATVLIQEIKGEEVKS
jgi:hypothetical protein